MNWKMLHPRMTEEHLGFLPAFLHDQDPRPAREQLHENYAHGGGWSPMKGWTYNKVDHSIKYPGDPKLMPLASAKLRDENIFYYDGAWVAIIQPNSDFEVARMD